MSLKGSEEKSTSLWRGDTAGMSACKYSHSLRSACIRMLEAAAPWGTLASALELPGAADFVGRAAKAGLLLLGPAALGSCFIISGSGPVDELGLLYTSGVAQLGPRGAEGGLRRLRRAHSARVICKHRAHAPWHLIR